MSTEFPVIVASKVRVRLEHRLLEVRMRLKIKIKKHEVGTYLTLSDNKDERARAWIEEQVRRHGVLKWERSGYGASARFGWVHKKPEKESKVG